MTESADKSFGYSASYIYLDKTLRGQWEPFISLQKQMDEFVPKDVDTYQEALEAEFSRLRTLNPEVSEITLRSEVESRFKIIGSSEWQFIFRYDEAHNTSLISLMLVAHALCEALINTVLALGLSDSGNPEMMDWIEQGSVVQKWMLGPRVFCPEYLFPRGSGMHETLKYMVQRRNALTHLKTEVIVNGARVLHANRFERKSIQDERQWMLRVFSLPYDMHDFVITQIPKPLMRLLPDRSPIERAAQHVVRRRSAS